MTSVTPVTLARDLFDLTGETALITGASSGLGARFAEVLAAHGAKVVLAARRVERLAALAERIGASARVVALDVADSAQIPAALDAAGEVSLLINNAGIAENGKFLTLSAETYNAVMRTNTDAVWHLSQAFAQRLIAARRPGAIVNIASILSSRVSPGSPAYCVSKAAVLQMSNMMALELARHRIRVNAIAPGYIMTEMTETFLSSEASEATRKNIPQRRTGVPGDLDGALLLLCSSKAGGFMTGATITVDGGHLLSFQ